MVKELGSKNIWLKDCFEYPLFHEDYKYGLEILDSLDELKEKFKNDWCIRTAFAYRDLVFINQIQDGSEWLTATLIDGSLVSFESISWRHIMEDNKFEEYWEQCQQSKSECIMQNIIDRYNLNIDDKEKKIIIESFAETIATMKENNKGYFHDEHQFVNQMKAVNTINLFKQGIYSKIKNDWTEILSSIYKEGNYFSIYDEWRNGKGESKELKEPEQDQELEKE